MNKPKDVDEYIAGFPTGVQQKMQQLRDAIKAAAPQAKEIISYSMPAYKQNGVLAYFAGWDKHIGFYPGASGIAHFKDSLSVYKGAKGSVQFPLDQPLPLDLVTRIVHFRIQQDAEIALARKMKKKAAK